MARSYREQPAVLLAVFLEAATKAPPAPAPPPLDLAVAKSVPEDLREAFSRDVLDCRKMMPIRDERTLYTDNRANGLLRRALVAVGDRLVRRGAVSDARDALWLELGDVRRLLEDPDKEEKPPAPGAAAALAAQRRRLSERFAVEDSPAWLNAPESGPPQPPDFGKWFPAGIGTLGAAFVRGYNAVVDEANAKEGFEQHNLKKGQRHLRGLAASSGTVTATARVLLDTKDYPALRKGEVAVTTATTASFNAYLPRCGAIVTNFGGILSHGALVAREGKIPAVVGCAYATDLIKTGDTVRVDGDEGTVAIL